MRHLLLLLCLISFSRAEEIHVAPTGGAGGGGTVESPFATLTQARDGIRKLRKDGSSKGTMKVIIHGGVYEMKQPLELEPQDGDVIYTAGQGENPVFLGAEKVEGFTQHEGDILKADVSKMALEKVQVRQL